MIPGPRYRSRYRGLREKGVAHVFLLGCIMGRRIREIGVAPVFLVGILAIVGVAFAATFFLDSEAAPRAVVAPRDTHAYGGGKARYVKACKGDCKKAKKTCLFCAKQDFNAAMKACKGQGGSCKRAVKLSFKAAKGDCKNRKGGCSGCCRADYSGQCLGRFNGTKGYGTFFRRYCTNYYGKKSCHTYKPDCTSTGQLMSPGVGGEGPPPRR